MVVDILVRYHMCPLEYSFVTVVLLIICFAYVYHFMMVIMRLMSGVNTLIRH